MSFDPLNYNPKIQAVIKAMKEREANRKKELTQETRKTPSKK